MHTHTYYVYIIYIKGFAGSCRMSRRPPRGAAALWEADWAYIYIYIYIHTHICMYVYIYIYIM